MAPEIELSITRGKTFAFSLLYADDLLQYLPITGMPSAAPCRFTVVGHGLIDGWPVRVDGLKSPAELNSAEGEYRTVRVVDADTIEFNEVNAIGMKPYAGGGLLIFSKPFDLTGWQCRGQVRDKVGGTLLFSWHSNVGESPDGMVLIEGAQVTLKIDAATTTSLSWRRGIYELELVSPTGDVLPLVAPSQVAVVAEVAT